MVTTSTSAAGTCPDFPMPRDRSNPLAPRPGWSR
jgi:hypothetical protein